MSAHTPGPWNLHQSYVSDEVSEVPPENGREGFRYLTRWVARGEKLVAEVGMMTDTKDQGWPRVNNPEECVANARLIAAAPELLAALESIVAKCDAAGIGANPDTLREIAATAIAKARGQS